MNEIYADSAQARQTDRGYGVNPVNTSRQPFAPVVRCKTREAEERAASRARILGAMGKMEDMLGMPRK